MRLDRRLVVALTAVAVVVPVLIALVALAADPLYPTGDMAQAELHVRGIWSHPPLVGAAGRIQSDAGVQGSHPGPSLWFAMYPVYALLGSTAHALLAGAASVSLAATALALWLARRRGGAPLAFAVLVVVAILVRASGPQVFTEPWNPWLAFVPFLAFVLCIWSLVAGDHRLWPLAVLLGSHCIQCHTGYIVVVLGLLAMAMIVGLAPLARRDRRSTSVLVSGRWSLALAVGAGIAMWVLPLVDQLTRDPGNAEILVQSFASPDAPYLSRHDAVEAFLDQMSIVGPWIRGAHLPTVWWPGVMAFAALWVGAVVIAWRRRDRGALQFHLVLAVAALLGAVSISRIFGSYFEYTVRWMWIVAGSIVIGSMVTIVRATGPATRRRAVGGAVLLVAALGVMSSWQYADRAAVAGRGDGRLVGGLVDGVQRSLDDDGRYLLRWWDPAGLGGPGFGLQLELERHGYTIGVDEQFSAAALPHRVLREDAADGVLYLVIGAKIDEVRTTPGLTEVAAVDPRTPAEATRSDALRAVIERRLVEEGRPDLLPAIDAQYGQARLVFADPPLPDDLAAAIGEFVALRLPGAVFLAAPGTAVPALGIDG